MPFLPLLAVVLLLASPPATADDASALVARVRPSVVTLQTEHLFGRRAGSGTGFLISADGLVVTNHHVAASGPSVALLFDGSRRAVLGLLVSDEESDVAILRIEGSGYPALTLGSSTPPALLDKVMVIGSPMGLDQTVTEGVISALRPEGLPPEAGQTQVARTSLLQMTAGIAPGSSGSPVLTLDGKVIGVAQSGNEISDTFFAVDIAAVEALQARAPADGALTPLDSPLRQLLLTLGLVASLVAIVVAPGIYRWAISRMAAWRRQRKRPGGPRPPSRFPLGGG